MDQTNTNTTQPTVIPSQNQGNPTVTASPLVSTMDISNRRHQELLNLKSKSVDNAMFERSQERLNSSFLPQAHVGDMYHDKEEATQGNWLNSLKLSPLTPLDADKHAIDEKLSNFNRTQKKSRRIQVMQNAPAFMLAGVLVFASVFASNLLSSSTVSAPTGANAGQKESSSSVVSSVSSDINQLENTKSILSTIYSDAQKDSSIEYVADALDKTSLSQIEFAGVAAKADINWLIGSDTSKLYYFDSSPVISSKGTSAILVQDTELAQKISSVKPGSEIIVTAKNSYGESVKWKYSVEKNNIYNLSQKEIFTDNSNSRMIFMLPKKNTTDFTAITAVFTGISR
jgi:hypothetical protein